jgi:hypothetical protein
MEKKKRDVSITKRFNVDDVKNWQEQANLQTGGNLTLWIENSLNKALPIKKVSKSVVR